jgi:hypothetical protein
VDALYHEIEVYAVQRMRDLIRMDKILIKQDLLLRDVVITDANYLEIYDLHPGVYPSVSGPLRIKKVETDEVEAIYINNQPGTAREHQPLDPVGHGVTWEQALQNARDCIRWYRSDILTAYTYLLGLLGMGFGE